MVNRFDGFDSADHKLGLATSLVDYNARCTGDFSVVVSLFICSS